MNLRSRIGIWRSVAMYYWKPFNKRRLKRFYSQFISKGDLCFDVGAHLGNRTDAWVALGAKVIAVEPLPGCVDFMARKFRADENVIVVPKAVGAEPGKAELYISRLTPTISTLSGTDWQEQIDSDAWYNVKWEDTALVELTTIDALIVEFGIPAFCKLDVENYEVEALSGLSQPVPQLSFEYYPPMIERALNCIDILSALGDYAFNWSFGESQKLEASNWLTAQEMKEQLKKYSLKKHYGDVYARLVY